MEIAWYIYFVVIGIAVVILIPMYLRELYRLDKSIHKLKLSEKRLKECEYKIEPKEEKDNE